MSDPETSPVFKPNEAEQARLDDEALADYRAGRAVPHAKVARWLDTWGMDQGLPCPKPERC